MPGQDRDELLNIIKIFNIYKVDFVLPLWLRYYPKIEIIKKAQEMGILTDTDIKNIEESKKFMPVLIKGNSFSPEMGELYNFLLLAQVLPKRLANIFIKKDVWR